MINLSSKLTSRDGCKFRVAFATIGTLALLNIAVTAQNKEKPKGKATNKTQTAVATKVAIPTVAPRATCSGANGLSAPEIDELLAAHNRVRADHKLAPMTWDCKLAAAAQEWATRGIFAHREF